MYSGTQAAADMLIFITGGARSGKSRHALELARRLAKKIVFVATATASDEDMRQRIARHRRERPKQWKTLENPTDLSEVFSKVPRDTELLLVDCLTLYVSGRLVAGEREEKIEARVEKFCKAAAASRMSVLLISNEVGSGLVPTTEWGLRFRDDLGRANQTAARYADQVIWMVSGLPVTVKGNSHGQK
jgi:adenosylcobinamide kinase/adenosylcobinamide-phosphate guanylyltransferase